MAKLFEKIDDNPGSYFGMLVEGYDSTYASVMKQADSDAQKLRDSWEKDGGKSLFDTLSELGYESDYEDSPYMFKDADGGNTIVFDFRPINSFENYVTYYVVDKDNRIPDGWTKTKLMIDFWKDKNESLKEDSEYKTLAKLSKGLEVISYPYGYAVSDGYVADRFVVRDGKYIFDDGRFRLSDKDKQKILSLIKKGAVEESLKESIKDWEYVDETYDDPYTPYSPKMYVKFPEGNDTLQVVIYPPQEGASVNDKDYTDWGAEIYSDDDRNISESEEGFNSFDEAEKWINSRLSDLGIVTESLKESKEELKYLPKTSTQIARNVIELAVQKFGGKMIRTKSKSSNTTTYAYKAEDEDQLTKAKEFIDSKIKLPNKEESLKEGKFVSKDKMSKKDRKELDSKKRNTWGNTNPVTKVQPNKKAYDRKRDKKELDEAKHFLYKENADKFREAYEYVQKIADEMLWDSKKKEIDYEDALYYYNKLKEATKMVYNSFIGDDNYDPYEDGNVVLRG